MIYLAAFHLESPYPSHNRNIRHPACGISFNLPAYMKLGFTCRDCSHEISSMLSKQRPKQLMDEYIMLRMTSLEPEPINKSDPVVSASNTGEDMHGSSDCEFEITASFIALPLQPLQPIPGFRLTQSLLRQAPIIQITMLLEGHIDTLAAGWSASGSQPPSPESITPNPGPKLCFLLNLIHQMQSLPDPYGRAKRRLSMVWIKVMYRAEKESTQGDEVTSFQDERVSDRREERAKLVADQIRWTLSKMREARMIQGRILATWHGLGGATQYSYFS